jgi:hypothetical protein
VYEAAITATYLRTPVWKTTRTIQRSHPRTPLGVGPHGVMPLSIVAHTLPSPETTVCAEQQHGRQRRRE